MDLPYLAKDMEEACQKSMGLSVIILPLSLHDSSLFGAWDTSLPTTADTDLIFPQDLYFCNDSEMDRQHWRCCSGIQVFCSSPPCYNRMIVSQRLYS